MKIAILTPTFSHFSGIDRLVEWQAEKLVSEGHSVDIYCLEAGLKWKHGNLVVMGMPASSFFQRMYRLLLFLDVFKVKKYGKELAVYDKVISHLYPMTVFAAAAKKINKGLTYVYHNAGVGIVDAYGFFEKQYLKLFNAFNNHYVKKCDSSVSISDFLRQELLSETGIDGTVEHIPVDSKRFNPSVSGEGVKKSHGITDENVLLYVGRISPHKGVDLLISAFNKVKEKIGKVKLIVVGKHTFPAYSAKLHALAGDDVIFAGFVSDEELPKYYAACDVYTTCSLWEGFDLPIKESEACGKPSVAFDVGSHPEVLKKGKLVKLKDVDGFAEAVVSLLIK